MTGLTKINLYFLDDSRKDLALFKKSAKQIKGYQINVTSFTTSEKFLATVKKGKVPDIAVLDINLKSRMDGFQVCKILAKEFPSIVIYMCSVTKEPETIEKASKLGCSGFISKHAAIDVQLSQFLKAYHRKTALNHSMSAIEATKHREKTAELIKKESIFLVGSYMLNCIDSLLKMNSESISLGTLILAPKGAGKTFALTTFSKLLANVTPQVQLNNTMTKELLASISGLSRGWLIVDNVETLTIDDQKIIFNQMMSVPKTERPKLLMSSGLSLPEIHREMDNGNLSSTLINYLIEDRILLPPLRDRSDEILQYFDKFYRELSGGPYFVDNAVREAIQAAQFDNSNISELENLVKILAKRAHGGKITTQCLPYELSPLNPRRVRLSEKSESILLRFEFDKLNYWRISNQLLLEIIRRLWQSDSKLNKRTTIRSIEERINLGRTAIVDKLKLMRKTGDVTNEELRRIFGETFVEKLR